MTVRPIPPELADGRTFYRLTISARDFRYASRAETRAAILRELRKYALVEGLGTTAQRVAIADRVLADDAWLRKQAGSVIAAVARDVFDAWLSGRWDNRPVAPDCPPMSPDNLTEVESRATCPCSESTTDSSS